ncbi:MAG TPA: hypothetical protein PK358_14985 [Spirochaetota bacterium]|nr:hypothetical protein [Spirochaetota bacterium]HPJ36143.1 hypothetical protein [Spirochaetota bacterium]
MKVKISAVLLLSALLFFSGCGYFKMMKQAERYNAIGGKYLLHDNPQQGDFARYKVYGMLRWRGTVDADISFEGEKVYWIEKIENDEIFIKENEVIQKYKVLKMKSGFMRPSVSMIPEIRRLVIDREGNIKRAWSNFRLGYVLGKAPLAVPGEDNFITWHNMDRKVDVTLSDKRVLKTRPVWYKKKAKLQIGVLHASQNAEYNTFEVHYNNPDVKFLTTMSTMMVVGKHSATLSWDKFLSNTIMVLTYTNLYSNPAEVLKKFVRENLGDFINSSLEGDEREMALKKTGAGEGLFDSTFGMSLNASMASHLILDGNSRSIYFRYKGLREPEGFSPD